MLPHGNTFAWGTVVSRKRDAEGNVVGCATSNPILFTHLYDVKFANDEVTALMANAITRVMYAQCDPERKKYILLVNYMTSSTQKMPSPSSNNSLQSMAPPANIHKGLVHFLQMKGQLYFLGKAVQPQKVPSSPSC